jgi:putative peptide zinc metalloprotease protein
MTARAHSRRLATVVLATGLVLGLAPAPLASAGHGRWPARLNVTVHASVDQDGRFVTRAKWQDRTTRTSTVTAHNEAVAYASCRGCGATAVAFQVLLAGRATDLTVTNNAVAVNEGCEDCATFAGAYQFVVAGAGDLRLTRAGAAALRRIRFETYRIRAARLQPAEAQARADALAEQVLQVLLTEVVTDSRPPREDGGAPVPEASGADGAGPGLASAEPSAEAESLEAQPSLEPEPSLEPQPSLAAEPSPEGEPSPQPSPEAEPSPEADPSPDVEPSPEARPTTTVDDTTAPAQTASGGNGVSVRLYRTVDLGPAG